MDVRFNLDHSAFVRTTLYCFRKGVPFKMCSFISNYHCGDVPPDFLQYQLFGRDTLKCRLEGRSPTSFVKNYLMCNKLISRAISRSSCTPARCDRRCGFVNLLQNKWIEFLVCIERVSNVLPKLLPSHLPVTKQGARFSERFFFGDDEILLLGPMKM